MDGLANKHFRRFLWLVVKWGGLALLLIIAGAALAQWASGPVFSALLAPANGKHIVNGRAVYDDKHTPHDFQDELNADPDKLIWENQAGYDRHQAQLNQPGANSGPYDDLAALPIVDREAIWSTVRAFLSEWESFPVGESDESYSQRLEPYVAASALSGVTSRADNEQNPGIGRDGQSGQTLLPGSLASPAKMHVLGYGSDNAYVAVRSEVVFTGPSLIWRGQKRIRSYGILLERQQGRWLIARCAGMTLDSALAQPQPV